MAYEISQIRWSYDKLAAIAKMINGFIKYLRSYKPTK